MIFSSYTKYSEMIHGQYFHNLSTIFCTRRMKKISKNRQSFLARKAMHIYKLTVLFLPIFGYFCLFLPICESVANLHESTLLFALNIHAIHETEIKPPGSKWSGPGPPEGRNRVEIGSK